MAASLLPVTTRETDTPAASEASAQPSTTESFNAKERAVLIGWLSGFAVLTPDLLAVLLANSVMLLADLLKTASEAVATFLSWLALRRIRQGHSFDYNYGQGKLENIASLGVAGALLLSWFIVVWGAVQRLLHPTPPGRIGMALLVTGGSACFNFWLWRKNRQLARGEASPILAAQARLYRAKLLTNGGVIAALVLGFVFRGHTWAAYLDPLGALLLSGVLLLAAYRVVTDSMDDLLDRTLDESLQLVILSELATRFDEYAALHGIRSRRSGSHIYIEIFMEFEGDRRMAEVQDLINRLRASLEARIKGSQVVIAPVTAPVN